MRTKGLIFITAMLLFIGVSKAQSTIEWKLTTIGMDGTNGYNGVEVYYATSSSKSGDVVLIKLINSNPFPVKAQWVSVMVTNDDKELYGKTQLVSYKLAANSEAVGSIKDKSSALTIKLSDYGIKASELRTFVGSSFDVIK